MKQRRCDTSFIIFYFFFMGARGSCGECDAASAAVWILQSRTDAHRHDRDSSKGVRYTLTKVFWGVVGLLYFFLSLSLFPAPDTSPSLSLDLEDNQGRGGATIIIITLCFLVHFSYFLLFLPFFLLWCAGT